MTKEKEFTKEELRSSALGMIDFIDINGISSISDLQNLNETVFPIGSNNHIVISSASSGSFRLATTIRYMANGYKDPVLEARVGYSPYGGYVIFRCKEEIKGCPIMMRDKFNIAYETYFGSLSPRDLKHYLNGLLGKLR